MSRSEGGPDGLLLVDKPEGPTSHDVVARVRRALGTRRVGHAGTLDPFATGLLACCVGRATRLVRWLVAGEKRYEGVIRFGFETDTGDRTGSPRAEPVAATLDAAALRRAAEALTGQLLQVPPMYSAKKREGVALHVLARRGEEVAREPVPVVVSRFDVVPVGPDRARFEVACSAGTYVRVLGEDLGRLVGVPAHLEALRRTGSGSLDVADAVSADALTPDAAREALIGLDRMPLPLPEAIVDPEQVAALLHGRRVRARATVGPGEVAMRSPAGTLLGIGRIQEGWIVPEVILHDPRD